VVGRGWAQAAGGGKSLSASTRSAQVWQTARDSVSREWCVPRKELPSLLGQRGVPAWPGGRGVAGVSEAGARFIQLKPARGQALAGVCLCWPLAVPPPLILPFSAVSGLCKVHLSDSLS